MLQEIGPSADGVGGGEGLGLDFTVDTADSLDRIQSGGGSRTLEGFECELLRDRAAPGP